MIGYGTKTNTPLNSFQLAFKHGYKLIDLKDSNKSIKNLQKIKFNRNKIILCSKLMGENSPQNHNPKNVLSECLKSLKTSNLNYWDIYYIHTTYPFGNYSILDTFNEIIKLKKKNLIKNTGLSNVTLEQLEVFIINNKKPDFIQIEIHPYLIEDEIVKLCNKNNIKIVCHSPFGSHKFRDTLMKEPLLLELSNKYDKSIYQIILKWHINRNIIPIPSSNNETHIKKNLDIDFNISQEDLYLINSLNKNYRIYLKPNHFEYRFIKSEYNYQWFNINKKKDEIQQPEVKSSDNEENNSINLVPVMQPPNSFGIYTEIINKINTQGYFVSQLQNVDNDLFKKIYKLDHCRRVKQVKAFLLLCQHSKFITNLAKKYFNEQKLDKIEINSKLDGRAISNSLQRTMTQLFHRDIQKNCLKIIIYLNDVDKYNGAFEIVFPEHNDNCVWYREKKTANIPRTTEYEIIKNKMNINQINGNKYTFLIFNGSITHRGGFIKKGYRKIINMELIHNSDEREKISI